jgi:hypothetical protein
MNHFFSPDLIFDVAISNGAKAQENDGCQISRLKENNTPAKRISPSDFINCCETPALSKVACFSLLLNLIVFVASAWHLRVSIYFIHL